MTTTQTSRLEGITTSVAIKAPCRVTSTSNITLSGLQTVDGVTVVAGDRVLVAGQTTGSENGIYEASTSAWARATDFNGARDIVSGTFIRVTDGTSNSGSYYVATANPITIGTTATTFTKILEGGATALSDLTGDSDDITQGSTNLFMSLAEKSKLSGIETGAEVNDDIVAGSNITVTGGSGSDWTVTGAAAAAEVNDLTASVTWANVPDANITESSVTQHEAALTVTSSQVSDLASSTVTFTNKTFDANGTGNSLSNVETADIASGSKSGSDTTLITGTAGTSGNLVEWNADGDAVDSGVASADAGKLSTVSVTGTTKTLALSDEDTIQECSNASNQTITIPTNASVAIATDSIIDYEQQGAGNVILTASSGVTLNGLTGSGQTTNQYDYIRTRKIGTDACVIVTGKQ